MAFIAKESSSESEVAFSSLVFLACFRVEHGLPFQTFAAVRQNWGNYTLPQQILHKSDG